MVLAPENGQGQSLILITEACSLLAQVEACPKKSGFAAVYLGTDAGVPTPRSLLCTHQWLSFYPKPLAAAVL